MNSKALTEKQMGSKTAYEDSFLIFIQSAKWLQYNQTVNKYSK